MSKKECQHFNIVFLFLRRHCRELEFNALEKVERKNAIKKRNLDLYWKPEIASEGKGQCSIMHLNWSTFPS